MGWRDGAYDAQDVTDSSLNSETLDSVAGVASGDVLGFATPSQFIDRFGTWHKGTWGMIVTDAEVVVGKKGLFGPKIIFRSPVTDLVRYGVGMQGGHGPMWEYATSLAGGGTVAFLFRTSDAAESIAVCVNDAVGGARDPDRDSLNRGMRMSRAMPPGEIGKELTPAQVIVEACRAREQLASGDYGALWERRVELGYGVTDKDIPQTDRFWLDAAAAIAAVRIGQKEHPMVAMCCGVAESNVDRSDPEQVEAVRLFNDLYFG
jgi:hypothetical protein